MWVTKLVFPELAFNTYRSSLKLDIKIGFQDNWMFDSVRRLADNQRLKTGGENGKKKNLSYFLKKERGVGIPPFLTPKP